MITALHKEVNGLIKALDKALETCDNLRTPEIEQLFLRLNDKVRQLPPGIATDTLALAAIELLAKMFPRLNEETQCAFLTLIIKAWNETEKGLFK